MLSHMTVTRYTEQLYCRTYGATAKTRPHSPRSPSSPRTRCAGCLRSSRASATAPCFSWPIITGSGPPKCRCCNATDVHAKQGRIYIPRVKGSIAKTYPLQPEDVRLVRAYLRTRADDSPYLFISTRGIPLERRSYWDLMQKYGKQAACPKRSGVFMRCVTRLRCICSTRGQMSRSCRTGWGTPISRTRWCTCATRRSPAMPRRGSYLPVIA